MTDPGPSVAVEESGKDFTIHEDDKDSAAEGAELEVKPHVIDVQDVSKGTVPLVSTKLGNIGNSRSSSATKKLKADHSAAGNDCKNNASPMDTLLAKLSAQQAVLDEQKSVVAESDAQVASTRLKSSEADISSKVPARDITPTIVSSGSKAADTQRRGRRNEVERLQQELDAAKDKIMKQEKELTKSRDIQSVAEIKLPAPCPKVENIDNSINHLQAAFNANRPTSSIAYDDSKSDVSEAISAGGRFNAGGSLWDGHANASSSGVNATAASIWNPGTRPLWMNRPSAPALAPLMVPAHQPMRALSGSSSPVYGNLPQYFSDLHPFQQSNGSRRFNNQSSRSGSTFNSARSFGWSSYGNSGEVSPVTSLSSVSFQPMGLFQGSQGYQPRPIGTPLSPTAVEFTAASNGGPWNVTQPSSAGQTYVPPIEPLNYRKLLDRSVSCNWKYIVDKIVCNNDQQASIFLQQKLKVGTAEQKYDIVEAIVAQAYPLMVNRFGNFLVQRCFEHGTPEQVVAIANAIRGNTLSLSMDAFGCHVVQKAFDAVPEEYKAIMVHELLRRIPETVIHRYACHVWQKLFELRWSDSPPQIMKYVNEALRGMWHEVALGETGSLVVQNIFENCLEEDKRPCIDEVLNSIDIVAHGQFGNWCIQHICEHGAPADRSRAIDHVLRYATEYSMDQFASKVVEKCLKIGGNEFLERYLERVCEGLPDRPRIPLIDIASDQYGNYLIQYILTHASAQHREVVASHVRKHMVSLRGSKFGSRVGLLCCNPAYATRPGPAVSASSNRFNNGPSAAPGSRFAGQFR